MKRLCYLALLTVLVLALAGTPLAAAQPAEDMVEIGGSVYVPAGRDVEDAVAIGGSVTVLGTVWGDAVAIGGPVSAAGDIRGSAVAIGGPVAISGNVGEDVVAVGGPVSLDGTVRGNVVSIGGGVQLSSSSKIQGQVITIFGAVHRQPGAEVLGGEFSMGLEGLGRLLQLGGINPIQVLGFFSLWGFLISLVLWGFTTLLATAIFPGHVQAVGDTIEREAGWSLVVGLAASVLVLPLTLVLMITIVGIPLVLVLWLALAAAKILGMAGFGMLVGGRVSGSFGWDLAPLVQVLIGMVILLAVTHIPLLGWLLGMLVKMVGLGAVLRSRFGTGRPWVSRTA
ncbi:hypothetical protein SY88_13130 [Clostridiales bacterium PH28_bin88]|nr:hypothetical protein SY88_13130 [Clostridiales bacterium PH28_bin88]